MILKLTGDDNNPVLSLNLNFKESVTTIGDECSRGQIGIGTIWERRTRVERLLTNWKI